MKKALTPGKWRGLKAASSANHTFSMLAFDQRGNYVRMLPEGTTYAQAANKANGDSCPLAAYDSCAPRSKL